MSPSRSILSLFGAVGGILALIVGLWMIDARVRAQVHEKQRQVTTLESSLAMSRQQLAVLADKSRVTVENAAADVYWSDELRMIGEKLPDEIWLTQVRANAAEITQGPNGGGVIPGAVVVEGGVLSSSKESDLDAIGKLIADLWADPRFQRSFTSVTLDSAELSADPLGRSFSLRLARKG